jgi:hypothetical protein
MANYSRRPLVRRLTGLVGLLLLVGLACNAPVEPIDPQPARETGPSAPPGEQPPVNGADESEGGPGSEEALPEDDLVPSATATPTQTATATATRQPSPTVGATPTRPPATATRTPRPLPSATATTGSSGPLDFSYNVSWMLSPSDPQLAIATVTINATGGGGGYRYYRDDLEVEGPVFSYEWGICRANPGSFRVDSSDGQSKKVDFFLAPPCPTPTPTS